MFKYFFIILGLYTWCEDSVAHGNYCLPLMKDDIHIASFNKLKNPSQHPEELTADRIRNLINTLIRTESDDTQLAVLYLEQTDTLIKNWASVDKTSASDPDPDLRNSGLPILLRYLNTSLPLIKKRLNLMLYDQVVVESLKIVQKYGMFYRTHPNLTAIFLKPLTERTNWSETLMVLYRQLVFMGIEGLELRPSPQISSKEWRFYWDPLMKLSVPKPNRIQTDRLIVFLDGLMARVSSANMEDLGDQTRFRTPTKIQEEIPQIVSAYIENALSNSRSLLKQNYNDPQIIRLLLHQLSESQKYSHLVEKEKIFGTLNLGDLRNSKLLNSLTLSEFQELLSRPEYANPELQGKIKNTFLKFNRLNPPTIRQNTLEVLRP